MKMLIDNSRGSEWHKCDLHMHSTASDGSASPKELVDEAVKKGIEMIALTDHHTVKSIDEIKNYGKSKGVCVISGIEFRTEYGPNSVHMIGLFPDYYNGIELSQKTLYDLVLSKLNLSESDIENKGKYANSGCGSEKDFKNGLFEVQVDFRKAASLVHKYGGIVTVHAGGKTNSIEEMKHEGKGITNVSIADSLGPLKEELLQKYIDICEVRKEKESIFYLNKWNKPCIAASDAHTVLDVGKNFCWIKSDLSFDGLKQIIYEPRSRVRIQPDKPEEKSSYLVIDKLEIDHPNFGNQIIPFNQGLNTIIGGRSSGKSVLLSCLARLCGDNKPIKPGKKQYDSFIDDVSQHMKIHWRDGIDNGNRKIDFFPQSYIIDMAADQRKIRELVDTILLDDNGENKDLTQLNTKLQNYSSDIHIQFAEYKTKISNIVNTQSEITKVGNKSGIEQEASKLEHSINEIKSTIKDRLSTEESNFYKEQIENIKIFESDINLNQSSIEAIERISNEELFTHFYSLYSLSDEKLREKIVKAYDQIKREASSKWKRVLESCLSDLREKNDTNKASITTIKEDDIYVKASKIYQENARLSEENTKLENEKAKLTKISQLSRRLNNLNLEADSIIAKIMSIYEDFYNDQEMYCTNHEEKKEDVTIRPHVVFKSNWFTLFIKNHFDGRSTKNSDVIDFEYNSIDKFRSFAKKFLSKLLKDEYVLKNGNDKIDVAEIFFSSNPFSIEYNINFQGDDLAEMSEGKTAFVILRLLLDFSKNEYPILIDQPEDDLDNRAIYQDLVSYLREKKLSRQIILVTHNPNVVVGADAEEIIVANQNGIGNKNPEEVRFAYISGALENTFKKEDQCVLLKQGIREHVCDILEGGNEAFQKREQKYQLFKQ